MKRVYIVGQSENVGILYKKIYIQAGEVSSSPPPAVLCIDKTWGEHVFTRTKRGDARARDNSLCTSILVKLVHIYIYIYIFKSHRRRHCERLRRSWWRPSEGRGARGRSCPPGPGYDKEAVKQQQKTRQEYTDTHTKSRTQRSEVAEDGARAFLNIEKETASHSVNWTTKSVKCVPTNQFDYLAKKIEDIVQARDRRVAAVEFALQQHFSGCNYNGGT